MVEIQEGYIKKPSRYISEGVLKKTHIRFSSEGQKIPERTVTEKKA